MSKDYGTIHFEAEVSWKGRAVIHSGTDIFESRKYSVLWPYHTLADIDAVIEESLLFAKKKIASLIKKDDEYHAVDTRVDFNVIYLPKNSGVQNKVGLWLFPGRINRSYAEDEPVRFSYANAGFSPSKTFDLKKKDDWKYFLLDEFSNECSRHLDDLEAYLDKS
jgi:hypothetical protein